MTEPDQSHATERLAEALRLCVAFQAAGRQDHAAFLAEHADLADLLEGMLSDPELTGAGDAVSMPLAELAIPVPADFGDYTVECEVGRGGMGIVVAARQRSLGRRVALKLLSRPLLQQTRVLVRFQREARLLARLEHPGIVRVIDAGTVGEVPYYAMDLVDGAPLSAVIDAVRRHGLSTATGATVIAAVTGSLERAGAAATDPPMPATAPLRQRSYLGACAELCAQVADALAFAHAAGVVHRDVKPSNVLVRRDGSAVLTDFGLARQEGVAAMTLTGDFAGTPFYVSPEQARGDVIDHRTDVYSLGVMLYELLTLRRPFDAQTTAQLFARIQDEEPDDPKRCNPDVPDDLAAIVLKAMAKESALRYAGAGELAADLRAWQAGLPLRARRPSRWQRLRRFVRREPWRAAALSTGGLAVAVVVGLSIGFTKRVIAERENAHANLDQAMQVVDEFSSTVGRYDLEDIPQTSAIRRDLLQRAVRFYEGFLAQRSRDPRVQVQAARARDWLGWVQIRLGDLQAAVAAHREAIAGFDAILAGGGSITAVRVGRARAQINLGTALQELGQWDAARAQLDEAIATLQAVPESGPGAGGSPRAILAQGLALRSGLLRERDARLAMADMRAAIAQLEVLVAERPQATDERAALAWNRLMLATLEVYTGDTAAAESLLDSARGDADRLAASAPEHVAARRLACLARDQLAVLYHDTGRPAAAVDSAQSAVERWQRLVSDFPLVPDYREHLGCAWSNLAGMRSQAGDRGGAVPAAREAVAVQEALVASYPDVPRYRYQLVRALVSNWHWDEPGDERDALHVRALAIAEALYGEHQESVEYAKVLADVLVDDGVVAREQGDRERAKLAFSRAEEVTAAAVARDPRGCELRDAHACALRMAAEEAHADGDQARALDLIDRGLAELRPGLQQEPRQPSRRRCMRDLLDVRLNVLDATGDHGSAARTLAERADYCDDAQDCYAVAVRNAIAARTATGTQRDALIERGLYLLQACLERGFAAVDRLEADADLAELRADPRFAAVRRAIAGR